MAEEYIKNLQRLQQQNFLGGVVQQAAAKRMVAQTKAATETVGELNRTLQEIEGGEPLTPPEQLKRLKEDPTTKKKLGNIEELATHFMQYQEKVEARKKQYEGAYSEALQKLAFAGGEEAQRLTQLVQQEREIRTRRLERKAEEPSQAIQFLSNVQRIKNNRLQYRSTVREMMRREDTQTMIDLIQNTEAWDSLPKGGIHYQSQQDFNNASRMLALGEEEIKEQLQEDPRYQAKFGDRPPSSGAFNAALTSLKEQYGVSLNYTQAIPSDDDTRTLRAASNESFMDASALAREYNLDKKGVAHFLHNVLRNEEKMRKYTSWQGESTDEFFDETTGRPKISKVTKYYKDWAVNPNAPDGGLAENLKDAEGFFEEWLNRFGPAGVYWDELENYQNSLVQTGQENLVNSAGDIRRVSLDTVLPKEEEIKYAIKERLGEDYDESEVDKIFRNYKIKTNKIRQAFSEGLPLRPELILAENRNSLLRGDGITWNPDYTAQYSKYLMRTDEGEPKGLVLDMQALIDENLVRMPEGRTPAETVTDTLFEGILTPAAESAF